MAFTPEQLAQLEAAAASGQMRVQLGDKVIQYQTLADMLTAIRLARADQQTAAGTPTNGFRFRVGRFDV